MKTSHWTPLLLAVGLVIWMTWPMCLSPLDVLGSPMMEADNHLWMLWRATRGVFGWEGPVGNWPVGDPRPVQDLVHLPVMVLLGSIDPALGYNACFAVDVALAALGGWWLSREVGAGPRGALVGMTVLATAPALAGALVFGISEAWPIGWLALHIAALSSASRSRRVLPAVLASIALAAFALSGWYNALFAALAEPFALGWLLLRDRPDRRVLLTLLLQGLAAVLLVVPAFAAFLGGGGDVVGLAAREVQPWSFRPDWRHGASGGTDPLNYILPSVHRTELARTVYLGVVSVLLGVVAIVRRREGRAVWILVSAVLVFCVLGLGHYLTLAGKPLVGEAPWPTPVALLTSVFSPLAAIANWYRAAFIAMVFLAPLAALGASRLIERRAAAWTPLIIAVVALDATLLSDAAWPRPTYEPRPPAVFSLVPGDGPVLLLPFDRGVRRWPEGVPRAYQRWQPWLDRPISENYEGPDALEENAVVAWLQAGCEGRAGRPDRFRPNQTAEEPTPEVRAQALAELASSGLERVVLVRPRTPTPTRCERRISAFLGVPEVQGEVLTWWQVGSSPPHK